MLYKVTPMMPSPEAEKARKAKAPGQPRKKRKSAIYDADGNEVLITLMCLKCRSIKPLANFGLRKMADGAIRNQPWCRTCRGGAGSKKKTPQGEVIAAVPSERAEAPVEPVSVSAEVAFPLTAEVAAPVQAADASAATGWAPPAVVVPVAAREPAAPGEDRPSLSDKQPTHPGDSHLIQPA